MSGERSESTSEGPASTVPGVSSPKADRESPEKPSTAHEGDNSNSNVSPSASSRSHTGVVRLRGRARSDGLNAMRRAEANKPSEPSLKSEDGASTQVDAR